ncbi:MAG: hypothetical protein C0410_09830 [Anaerolinea sp.]|nr:hypothetical protein [Anaerolinea sp.]
MPNASLTCKYCGASNPPGTNRCLACGAPIDLPIVPPVTVTTINTPARNITPPVAAQRADTTPEQIRDAFDAAPINDQLKEGLKAAGMGIGALGVGTFFARTASEAVSIAFSSFLIGYFSSATGNKWLAIPGGLVIGLMVGLAVKRPLGVLISAPLGSILGLVAGFLLQPGLPTLPLPPLLALIGGAVLAIIGSRRNSGNVVAKWYGRFRPLLGMAGGFLFALLGFIIGGF